MSHYYTTHCIACREPLGEWRRKVTLHREEPYSDRHPTWRRWRSDGSFYVCESCMGRVLEAMGVR